jgi:amidase
MTLKPPSRSEIEAIARDNRITVSPAELNALEVSLAAQIKMLSELDTVAAPPQPSVDRYRNRTIGLRPSPAEDPLNAIVRRVSVKGASSGPLAGKRIGVKDSVCVAGVPASAGSHVMEGYVADFDATIVARMLDAGAEIVATLNMDDFALSGDGRTSFYGPARNPHNREYCTGGSSCGSAAALYYDGIDMTIGTDQGGSIRMPASWSGVVGIKPTYTLVPYTGVMSIDPSFDHVGPMARRTADVALLLEVIAGKDPTDFRQDAVAVEPYTAALNRGVAGLKIGIVRDGFQMLGAEEDVNAAVRRAIDRLVKLGARAGEISIPGHRNAYQWLFAIAEGMAMLARTNLISTHHRGYYSPSMAEYFGEHIRDRSGKLAITVKFMAILGGYLTDRYHGSFYAKAQNFRPRMRAWYDAALAEYDILAMPTTPMKANRIDEDSPYSMLTNTAPFDLTGHPAISVPCAMSKGLPVGLMLIGRHFQDATLLRAAHALEQDTDWTKV